MKALSLLANSKAALLGKESTLEASLNELERLRNTLVASTNDLAGSRATNSAKRCIIQLDVFFHISLRVPFIIHQYNSWCNGQHALASLVLF